LRRRGLLAGFGEADANGAEHFAQFHVRIRGLEQQHADFLSLMELQRSSLRQEWDEKIDAENIRHLAAPRRGPNFGRGASPCSRTSEILSDEEPALADLINHVMQQHSREVNGLERVVGAAHLTDDIEKLAMEKEEISATDGAKDEELPSSSLERAMEMRGRVDKMKDRHQSEREQFEKHKGEDHDKRIQSCYRREDGKIRLWDGRYLDQAAEDRGEALGPRDVKPFEECSKRGRDNSRHAISSTFMFISIRDVILSLFPIVFGTGH
jgi:hypothetical protein